MRAVAHNPKFAKKVGIPQSVGRDFAAADKRAGKYAVGGGVLGRLGPKRMGVRPVPDVRTRPVEDMLRTGDQALANAKSRLMKIR